MNGHAIPAGALESAALAGDREQVGTLLLQCAEALVRSRGRAGLPPGLMPDEAVAQVVLDALLALPAARRNAAAYLTRRMRYSLRDLARKQRARNARHRELPAIVAMGRDAHGR